VKVGRAALDEDAIRLIEQLNPGIEFDWTRILKGQGPPATDSRPPAEVRRQRPDNRRPQPPPTPAPPKAVQPSEPVAPADVAPTEVSPPEAAGQVASSSWALDSSADQGAPIVSDVPTPAHARLGAEGVQRLRARYAEILVRISERTGDPARREELKAQADRLNPDGWVTDDEVVQGLEQYESVFASLREVVGQKRRRRRRGRGPRPAEQGAATDSSVGQNAGDSFDSSEGPEGPEDNDGPDGNDNSGGGDLPPGGG
jgi:hypothetical protein